MDTKTMREETLAANQASDKIRAGEVRQATTGEDWTRDARVERMDAGAGRGAMPREMWSFGKALERLKDGYAVTRTGWNGKGQYVYLEVGSFYRSERDNSAPVNGVPLRLFQHGDFGTSVRLPVLVLRTAQGNLQPGWLASQSDMLAEDWILAQPEY